MSRVLGDVRCSVVLRLLAVLSSLAACHCGGSEPPVSPGASAPSVEPSPAPGPIASREDLARAVAEGLSGRVDLDRGVVFVDTWDDEGEEPKPRRAVRLCGARLEAAVAGWIADLRAMRLQVPEGYGEEVLVECTDDRCAHEAAEAIDHRGEYRFERGRLVWVAFVSGPPGHVMAEVIDAELAFAARAVAALADAPCGAEISMDDAP